MTLSFNRDTLALFYYPVGLWLPVGLFVAGLLIIQYEKWKQHDFSHLQIVGLGSIFSATIMFPETRLSIIGVCVFGYILLERFYFKSVKKKVPTQLLLPFILTCFVTFFLSEHRILGRSLTRFYIVTIQQEHLSMLLLSILLIVGASLLYLIYVENIQSRKVMFTVSAMYGLLPVAMWFKRNAIDWVVLSILLMFLFAWFAELITKKRRIGISPIHFVGFAWVTISWGSYAGATTMILYSGFYYLSQREFKFLMEQQRGPVVEATRYVLVALIPIVFWFTWWATMGQLDGLTHPRDIDPGNLYLTGGYIGDRESPSNTWVGFMGGGPMGMMTILIFHMFRSINWPLHLTVWFCVLRVAFLSIHLSVSPNLPRLVFKISWDIVLYSMIAVVVLAMIGVDRLLNQRHEKPLADAS